MIATTNDNEDDEIDYDENDDDTDNENEDFEQENSIQICCAWGNALADGRLTYFIDGKDSSEKQQQAVRNAIEKWDENVDPLELEESSAYKGSDIRVDFKEDNEEDTAGRAANTYDGNGLLTKVEITIFKGASGDKFYDAVIERISEHEIGHALGLGHANFDGNLMAELVDEDIEAISECKINAV